MSPWNKPKLIEMALREQDRRDIDDVDALLQFCRTQYKGPRHAAGPLFTVYCTVLGYLWNDGAINEAHIKRHTKLLRDAVKKIARTLHENH